MALQLTITQPDVADKIGYLRIYAINNVRGQGQMGGNGDIPKFSYTALYKIHENNGDGEILSVGQHQIPEDGTTNYWNIYEYSYNIIKDNLYPDAVAV